MTTNLTATFLNFIYSPTVLVKYFTPSSFQTSNTSHFHTHTQLMALLPILLKQMKEIKKEPYTPATSTHPPASVLVLNYLSSHPELVLPIFPSLPTQGHHPSNSPLSCIITLPSHRTTHILLLLPLLQNPSLDSSWPHQLSSFLFL